MYIHHKFLSAPSNDDIKLVATHVQRQSQVYFKIVPITLFNGKKSVKTYALLDDGSQVTLAEKWIFDQLEVNGINSPLNLKWTGDQHRSEEDSILFSVMAAGPKETFKLDKVQTVEKLELPTQTIDVIELQDTYEHLQDLPLIGYEDAKPRILIGLNNAKLLTLTNIKEGRSGEPVAAKSRFRWVVFGNDGNFTDREKCTFHLCECHQENDNSLNALVRDFIALDNLNSTGNKKEFLFIEDKRAIDIMKSTTEFKDGKYEIGLLWRFESFRFPDSYSMALRRLVCLERQMEKDPSLYQQFSDQIRSYLMKGYARKLTKEEVSIPQSCWYLPMFLVKNDNKPNKIRPVWDAAASIKNVCLNFTLLKGPDQLAELPGVQSQQT